MPGGQSGWSNMTAEERSQEMLRRMEVARQNKKRKISPAGMEAIKEAQRRRWREAKQAGGGRNYKGVPVSRESPFPATAFTPDYGSIKQRLEAIEAAVAKLKADVGF